MVISDNYQPRLFGINQSNRDFTKKSSWGKNQFIAFLRLMRYTLPSCRYVACNVSTKNYVPHEYEKCYIVFMVVIMIIFDYL